MSIVFSNIEEWLCVQWITPLIKTRKQMLQGHIEGKNLISRILL